MNKIIDWWVHLSWSEAAAWAFSVASAVLFLYIITRGNK